MVAVEQLLLSYVLHRYKLKQNNWQGRSRSLYVVTCVDVSCQVSLRRKDSFIRYFTSTFMFTFKGVGRPFIMISLEVAFTFFTDRYIYYSLIAGYDR